MGRKMVMSAPVRKYLRCARCDLQMGDFGVGGGGSTNIYGDGVYISKYLASSSVRRSANPNAPPSSRTINVIGDRESDSTWVGCFAL